MVNCVTEIIELLPAKHWHHVKGTDNPADLISRGATLHQLKDAEIWWSGPKWLREKPPSIVEATREEEPPDQIIEEIQVEERGKTRICALANNESLIFQELIEYKVFNVNASRACIGVLSTLHTQSAKGSK